MRQLLLLIKARNFAVLSIASQLPVFGILGVMLAWFQSERVTQCLVATDPAHRHTRLSELESSPSVVHDHPYCIPVTAPKRKPRQPFDRRPSRSSPSQIGRWQFNNPFGQGPICLRLAGKPELDHAGEHSRLYKINLYALLRGEGELALHR